MSVQALRVSVGVVLLSVCACSESNTTSPTPSSTPGYIQSKLVLTGFDPTLKWIPTQFAPKIVERQSVSRVNEWPKNGDIVTVLCTLEGEPYGNGETKWYSIIVPPEELNPGSKAQAEEVTGGYQAYLEAMWLPDVKNAPSC